MSLTDCQLFEAVEGGDYEKVKQLLLNQKVDVNQSPRHQKGFTPLMRACEKGDLKMITLLLENGASLKSLARDGSDPFNLACEFGDLEIVQFLFEKGSSLHPISRTPNKTALSSVCEKGHFEIAKFLIEKGAKVDQTKTGGKSPLWICCERGDIKMANLLIDNKAKVDWSTNKGGTSFCCACKRGDFEMAQLLINKGANINFSSRHSWSPLCFAVLENDIKMVHFLLEKGAHPNTLSKDQMSPFHIACQKGNLEIVKTFLKIEDLQIDQPGNLRKTALYEATEGGHFDIVTLLVERGASINFRDQDEMSPWHVACQKGNLEIVKTFLKIEDLQIDQQGNGGKTALYEATEGGHFDIITLLVERGASINFRDQNEMSPWHVACQKGNLEIVKFFLKIKDLQIDQQGKEGITALCEATEGGHFDIITLLVERGASINFQNRRIHNPFHIACKLGDLKIVSFFTKHGAQLQVGNGDGLVCACEEGHRDVISYLLENMKEELNVGPLCFASREGEFDLAQFLISKNCPINGVHNLFSSRSPLTLACLNNNLDIAELLLQNGAHLIAQGKSVLHQVCVSRSVTLPVVKILVENGADVNEIYQGRTPLMALLRYQSGSFKLREIVLFMLKNGVEINKTNEDGSTALHVAASRGKLELVKLLCEYGANPEIKNNQGQTPADTTSSQQVKKFLEEYIHIDGSIKPAKREGNEKIESNGKGEQREGEEQKEEGEEQRKGEEQGEEGEERESKKRKIGDECGFGDDEIEFKKPRMD